jgi:hypothetical protein
LTLPLPERREQRLLQLWQQVPLWFSHWSMTMKRFAPVAAYGLIAFAVFAGGCVTPEHRMNVAESRDQDRRADFEHCRAQGRSDCDVILNAPVNSSSASGDSVRERERRAAYDRCVAERGNDCADLLRH